MSWYPGDVVTLILPLQRNDGTGQVVSSTPKITILNAADGTTALASTDMEVLAGSVYRFGWNTAEMADGVYAAFVSYVAEGLVVQDKFLASVQLGDSRITGIVAQDATVAKNDTVAKSDEVLKAVDYVAPDNSPLLQTIKARLDELPSGIANEATLQGLLALVNDLHDASLGSLVVDKAQQTLSMIRKNNSPLQSFQLVNTDEYSSRVRV